MTRYYPSGGLGQFFLAQNGSRIYPNMWAKFGCGPKVVSKKGGGYRQTDRQTDRQRFLQLYIVTSRLPGFAREEGWEGGRGGEEGRRGRGEEGGREGEEGREGGREEGGRERGREGPERSSGSVPPSTLPPSSLGPLSPSSLGLLTPPRSLPPSRSQVPSLPPSSPPSLPLILFKTL